MSQGNSTKQAKSVSLSQVTVRSSCAIAAEPLSSHNATINAARMDALLMQITTPSLQYLQPIGEAISAARVRAGPNSTVNGCHDRKSTSVVC